MISDALKNSVEEIISVDNRGKVFILNSKKFPDDYWESNINGFPDHVFSVRIEYADEVGKKKNRMHIHCIICIEHESSVKIDVKEMRNIINKTMSEDTGGLVTHPYIYIRFMSNNLDNAKRYLSKDIPSYH